MGTNRPGVLPAGAYHILAWVCRDSFPGRSVKLAAVRFVSEQQVIHVYATWRGWAFDHSGWNPEPDLLRVNADFERKPLERLQITGSLAEFCEEHNSRMPDQYWRDPLPRAREYVRQYARPWA